MSALLFALAGAAAGGAQAGSLARAARGQAGPFAALARVGAVGAVLLLSAITGALAFGAGGWLAGFASTVAAELRRS